MNNMIANIRTQLQKLKCRIANLTKRVAYIEDNCCNGGGGGDGIQSIVAGDNISVDNTDPQNPVVSSTGGGIEDMPDVSATERGVVNNEPLQELGGADKLINGVRVGTGSAENSDTNIVLGKNSLNGEDNEGKNNVAVGNYILTNTISGIGNVGVGNYALTNSLGNSNTAIGYASSYRLGDGDFNTTVGAWSGDGTGGIPPTGERNTFIGAVAAPFIESGSNNISIGYRSANALRTGNHNIMIGIQSGDKTTSTLPPDATWDFGDRNIFIGRLAGVWTVPNLAEDYLLIHSYSNQSGENKTPLILGHFADRFFRVGGVLELDPQFLPTPDATFNKKLVYNPTDGKVTAVDDNSLPLPEEGSAGQVLTTDGDGSYTWEDISGGNNYVSVLDVSSTPTADKVVQYSSSGNVNTGTPTLPENTVNLAHLNTVMSSKVDVVPDMGLSKENFTTEEKSKLAGLESPKFKGQYLSLTDLQNAGNGEIGGYAYVDNGVSIDMYIWDNTNEVWDIVVGESTTETPASIKSKYESNPDTNAFTDVLKNKLEAFTSNFTVELKNTYDTASNIVTTHQATIGKVWTPDYSNMEATNRITTSGGTWTVPAGYKGWVNLFSRGYNGSSIYNMDVFIINGKPLGKIWVEATSGSGAARSGSLNGFYPVKEGDVIQVYGNLERSCYFIPGMWV